MKENDPKIVEAIEFFEAILESMPDDRTSLEFLAVAYDQVGAMDKRRRCLIALIGALLNDRDFEKVKTIARYLKAFPDDSGACAAVARAEQALAQESFDKLQRVQPQYEEMPFEAEDDGSLSIPDPVIKVHAYSRAALAAEMDLVWMLKDKGIVSKEVSEELIHELSEFPVVDKPQLISAMAFLDDKYPECTESVMCELQRLSNMPAIPLELFDYEGLVLTGIATAYLHVRGVVPFARLAEDFLIGVMNPLDTELQADVASRLGATCHFFLAHPRACQQILASKFT
ncbi:MAG: hypothetical protein PHO37_03130 [Kiritimatiellae bacterium]|nr:hypothetical protein [Kiritimatiellia bacterium]